MKSGSMSSYRAALSGTGADFGGEPDDEPVDPYCPSCGKYTRSGVTCEDCELRNHPDVCRCGLTAEEHVYPTVDHNFVSKHDNPPCRVCGVSEKVLVFSDNYSICPDCCDKAEHPDGEKGHRWVHDPWERDYECKYCGIYRRYTDWEPDRG